MKQKIKPKFPQSQEMKYYGFHSCLKLFSCRPKDIIRVYVEKSLVKEVSPLLRFCAENKKAYHLVSTEELLKITDSVHHEGLCVLAKELSPIKFTDMVQSIKHNKKAECLIYLDGVQNPHNLGSIMRVAAHFGVGYIIGEKSLLPKLSPSAFRVAQGGAEYVKLVPLENIKKDFAELKSLGFELLLTSSHKGIPLYQFSFKNRTLIIFGSESEGVNKQFIGSIKQTLSIPGTGSVESLNVSVATGLLLGEFWRQTWNT